MIASQRDVFGMTIRRKNPIGNLDMTDPNRYSKWRPHPWHGLDIGPSPPHIVHAYIEITPFDFMKYEVDKRTGYMVVDRPQRTSSEPPSLYGFIPRTYCGNRVGALMKGVHEGDGDPLDICVFSERPINRAEVILEARVVGGIPMVDGGMADDKIIAVLENDLVYKDVENIHQLPGIVVERLIHYFTTYKLQPGHHRSPVSPVSVGEAYDRKHAHGVIEAAIADYSARFSQSA